MLEFFQRQPPCLIGMEACASAHYWARELNKFGDEVRLMQPSYVYPHCPISPISSQSVICLPGPN